MNLHEIAVLHSIRLAIDDSLSSQKAINDAIKTKRKVVGLFSLSSVACERLGNFQEELGKQREKLVQVV